ncbi:MAG: NADH-quinone oxidoreductase subunit L [Myxococcales bacterium]|nr:NADH-quinone oxidoreductase subunit L [Myxococcales bacterium]
MHELHLPFQPEAWLPLALIIGAPLFGAFFNGVFGKRLGKPAVRIMALTVMGVSFLAALYTFVQLHALRHHAEELLAKAGQKVAEHGAATGHAMPEHPTKLSWLAWRWMDVATGGGDGRMSIDIKYSVDELSGVMMLVVTGIGFLIHLYSTSYMAKDPGYHRFFAYLNLFIFSMLTLILADNLPLLFVGWEGVGACSYLLIGFWFEKAENAAAGRKAFIANRIGDVGVIGGMLLLAYCTGALDWDGIAKGADGLLSLQNRIPLWTSGGKVITASAATVACLALLLGCTGKSAQIPLYVWLPDAMAGPTPVSALIHAATMVTSGLYLICRLNFVFALSPFAMMVVAIVGALTALFAATIGLVQNDIKKVLAYSTVSQLGFMFLGVGVGAFDMGFFHVFTHAFFKACLFLGAGSVIHAMHARIHDDVRSQDMRNMGGLRKFMPWTYYSMGAATLAIAGFPLTAGFFSKDGILFKVWSNRIVFPHSYTAGTILKDCAAGKVTGPICKSAEAVVKQHFQAPEWLGKALFAVGILAATCTAFYMFRLLFKTFWGEFRGWNVDPNAALAVDPFANAEPLEDHAEDHAAHADADDDAHGHDEHGHDDAHAAHVRDDHAAHDDHGHDEHGHDDHGHHHEDLVTPAEPPAEAPWQMALPVAILGAAALFVGFLYAEALHVEPLGHWLAPVFHTYVGKSIYMAEGTKALEWPLMGPGVAAFAVGCGLAYFWYVVGGEQAPKRLAEDWPRLHRAAYNKWYVDEAYEATVIGGADALADGAALMDQWIIDGIIAKLTALLVNAFGAILRAFQTGVVHVYAGFIALGTLAIFAFFVRPHADFTLQHQGDTYTVEAPPGLGYEYRWEVDQSVEQAFTAGDGALKRTVTVPLGEKKTVSLEVKNAFGLTRKRTVEINNPKPVPLAPTASVKGKAAPVPPTPAGAGGPPPGGH